MKNQQSHFLTRSMNSTPCGLWPGMWLRHIQATGWKLRIIDGFFCDPGEATHFSESQSPHGEVGTVISVSARAERTGEMTSWERAGAKSWECQRCILRSFSLRTAHPLPAAYSPWPLPAWGRSGLKSLIPQRWGWASSLSVEWAALNLRT